MNPREAYYRAYQAVFSIGAKALPWRRPIAITGRGCINRIPRLLKENRVKKVMIVSGRHTGKTLVPRIISHLDKAGVAYVHFDAVSANPTTDMAEKIRALYQFEGCEGFVAVGGGSPMDAAKAAAARLVRPEKTVEQLTGLLKVRKKLPPFIAVPTTAGSGSETTIAAVITDVRTHHKHALMDLCLVPQYAVLDPELTQDLPPDTTACTGMDALTHALEAYLCRTNNTPETLRLAEEAIVDIFRYLERAYREGHDLEAREKMLMASFKAGFAFTRAGVGYVHAIAHTFGGLYNVAHGLANAVILPIVLEDYGAAVCDKLGRAAELTGVKTRGSTEEKAKALIREIREMNCRMGIPEHLDMGQEKDIPQMVEWALMEANPTYPVPVLYDKKHCAEVIRRVMGK